ncbi:MAG: lamin tail domain-containing protein [Anaerolineae bacterium]
MPTIVDRGATHRWRPAVGNRKRETASRTPVPTAAVALPVAVALALAGAAALAVADGVDEEHAPAASSGAVVETRSDAADAAARPPLYFPLALAPRRVPPLEFGVTRGFYEAPFDLKLTAAAPDSVIRYTTDGSLPTAGHGSTYSRPILIDTTTVVRAAAFAGDQRITPVGTHTYEFIADAIRVTDKSAEQMGYPKSWGKYTEWRLEGQDVPADYGMSQRIVGTEEQAVRQALRAVPSMMLTTDPDDMFEREGIYANPLDEGREVPASVEYVDPAGAPGFQIDCGLRIAGNWSRKPDVMKKHALSLRFRSRYGPSRLEYDLFPGSPVTSFDTLRLRGSQADSFMYFADKGQYMHDQWARDTQRAMGWLSPYGAYVQVYLNGLYWGLYNLTEEPTAAFVSDHLGGAEADWDVIKDGPLVDGEWIYEVEDGDAEAYRALLDVVAASPNPDPRDPADLERYQYVAANLNLAQHADYNLIQIYGANVDWPEKNYRAARDRVAADGFQFFIWDYEHTTALRDDPSRGFCQTRRDPATGECGYQADTPGVAGLHGWLSRFPDYRVLFADRAALHLFGDGALTPGAAGARYTELADVVERAIAGESARWGSDAPEPRTMLEQLQIWRYYRATYGDWPQTQAMWRAERDRLLGSFFPVRTAVVLGQLCRQGLYPAANTPVIDASGDTLSVGVSPDGCPGGVTSGQLWYTLDGSDPREPITGAVSARARAYEGPVHLSGYAVIKARQLGGAPDENGWSALASAVVGSPRLRVSEIMYNPPGGSDFEFLELESLESAGIDLSGFGITDAVTFTFPSGVTVGPRGHVVIAKDTDALGLRYPGVDAAGEYDGKLDNGGDTITVSAPDGMVVAEVQYDDDGFWPLSPDGMGYSLVPLGSGSLRMPAAGALNDSDPESWRASAQVGGSPGIADPAPPPGRDAVVVNEVLANPGPNQEDAIELVNISAEPVDVGGWYLSDDRDELTRFRIPEGTTIEPGAFVVLYEEQLTADPDHRIGLSARGETVFLSSADPGGDLTGAVRAVEFGAAVAGTSLGRLRLPVGPRFVAQSRPTFGVDAPASVDEFRTGGGAANAPPAVGPVVLSEIMYQPSDGDEFVELRNVTTDTVKLHDPNDPARAWHFEAGVGLALPPGAEIPPNGFALAVAIDPGEFRARYGIPEAVPVFGPYDGALADGGETVALVRPWPEDPTDDETVIVVDSVTYGVRSPWPERAAGHGPSLERAPLTAFGDDPRPWTALTDGGTPGRENTPVARLFLPAAYQGH